MLDVGKPHTPHNTRVVRARVRIMVTIMINKPKKWEIAHTRSNSSKIRYMSVTN